MLSYLHTLLRMSPALFYLFVIMVIPQKNRYYLPLLLLADIFIIGSIAYELYSIL